MTTRAPDGFGATPAARRRAAGAGPASLADDGQSTEGGAVAQAVNVAQLQMARSTAGGSGLWSGQVADGNTGCLLWGSGV